MRRRRIELLPNEWLDPEIGGGTPYMGDKHASGSPNSPNALKWMVPVRGYVKGGDAENVQFAGIAGWASCSALRSSSGRVRIHLFNVAIQF